jgi:hypothetical protein
MKATKKQINAFLKSHNLQADDLLAHDALKIIKPAYAWAKQILSTKHMKWGFYNVADFKKMIRVEATDKDVAVTTTGQLILL